MTSLIVLASVILLIIVAVQIGKISELSAKIRGEEAAQADSNNFNAKMGLYFLVGFLVFCIASAWYYKDYMLGYGLKHASIHGEKIHAIFNVTLFFTGIVFVITHILLFWFAYKYKAEKGRKVLFIADDHKLERIWTAVPALVMCALVIFGLVAWNDAMKDVEPGEDYIEIEATAYQFAWDIRYPGKDKILGEKYYKNIVTGVNDLGINFNDPTSHDDFIADEIVLPKGKKIRVRITSKDVLHNFGASHFMIKMDAIPGLPTYFTFVPTITTEEYRMNLKKNPGYNELSDPEDPTSPKRWESFNFELACMELCGKGHFSMRKIIRIVSPEEYEKWLEDKKSFFEQNVKGKLEGKYTWYKGDVEAPKPAAEFSAAAVESAKAGDVLNLNHVTFATGSAILTTESSKELDLVVETMTKNANMTVEVSGHTDNVGNAAKNQSLSEARAKAVVDYVAKKGIDIKRMTGVGFGDTKPVADNSTPEGRQQNRRTEFKILTK